MVDRRIIIVSSHILHSLTFTQEHLITTDVCIDTVFSLPSGLCFIRMLGRGYGVEKVIGDIEKAEQIF